MASTDHSSHPSAPRIHHDPLAARRVFVAPDRAGRPGDADHAAAGAAGWCPFCAGNEAATPPAVLQAPADPARPWRARIVPNRYPVTIDAQATTPMAGDATGETRLARGVHDVVIEAAAHEHSILAVPQDDWRDVWELCRRRLAMFADRGDLAWATIFKNSGPAAGASLAHVHSQIVALDFVPPAMEAKMAAAAQTPFAAVLASARADGRIVREQGGLVALVPHAPRQPCETWIVPLEPEHHLHAASGDQIAAVADLTRWFVGRLAVVAPGADFNWWLHQWPFAGHARPNAAWHWHLEMMPRLAPLAGFELGTGCHITTMTPAESARRLRGDA